MELYLPIAHMSVHWLMIPGMGAAAGFLSSVFGICGGFIMVPVTIHLLWMSANVVVGTSLFQLLFVTVFAKVLCNVDNYSMSVGGT